MSQSKAKANSAVLNASQVDALKAMLEAKGTVQIAVSMLADRSWQVTASSSVKEIKSIQLAKF